MGFCCQLLAVSARRSRATSRLAAIVSKVQMRRISAVGCTSGRMEGDRRKAVVEDSLTAQAIYNLCRRRHPNFKRLMLILTLLHTVAPLVRERLWRSRTLHRSTCRTVPLYSKRGAAYGGISVFLSFKIICVNRLFGAAKPHS